MSNAPSALVLASGHGRDRSALATVRALAIAGYRPVVGVSHPHSLAASSNHADRVIPLPNAADSGYVDFVADFASSVGAVAVFPSNDVALLALEPGYADLIDKTTLAHHAAEAGLAVPPALTFPSAHDLVDAADTISYPAVVKPALKQSNLPVYAANQPADVLTDRHVGPVIVQPFLDGAMDAICGVAWSGEIVASLRQEYLRTWPNACGTASLARTTAPDQSRMDGLARLLSAHNGIFQAQFIGGALIDLNLRPYGSMPLALRSGLNLPELVCRLAAGEAVERSAPTNAASYRWIEGDLRNLWHSVRYDEIRVSSALRSALPRRAVAHSVVSVRDVRPTLTRLRHAATARRSRS